MNNKSLWGYIIAITLLFASCIKEQTAQLPANKQTGTDTKEQLLRLNQLYKEEEEKEIQAFLDSTKQTFLPCEDGFWYHIEEKGVGQHIVSGQAVVLTTTTALLNGETCLNDTLEIISARRQSIKGLDLALPLLKKNSQATIVFPSHLAYGKRGFAPCITPMTPVIVSVHIIDVK